MGKNKNILWDLFITFAKIGAFTFGGGYAMIAMINETCVSEKKWMTNDEMLDITVIAESTPGPFALNAATYIGYQRAGFLGAIIASLGMVLPSTLLIFLISSFLTNFLEIPIIAKAFSGIKIAVGILIFDAALTMLKKMPKKKMPVLFMTVSFAIMSLAGIFSFHISSIQLMIIAAVISLSIFVIKEKQTKEKM